MQFIKRNIWSLAALVLVMVVTMVGDASAQSSASGATIMDTATSKTVSVFQAVKTIISAIVICTAVQDMMLLK